MQNETATPPHGRKLRIGIVGCGEVTQILHQPTLAQLHDRYEVTALCDVSSPVLEELGSRWRVDTLTTDHRALSSREDVDAVLVANPNAYHAEATLAAIEAGKHVLVEKPMCVNRGEAERIIEAQRRRAVVVQVGYMRRYAPAFVEACELVRGMDEVAFARVHAFIGQNALIIDQTSRVVRDDARLPELRKAAREAEERSMAEVLGETGTALKRAYALMLGLSSHDLSAMREMLGVPKRVLYATQRLNGGYLSAAFDYGSFVCAFETGIDAIPRFDTHLEVYGTSRVVRVKFDTPYVRNLPTRVLTTEVNGRGGALETDVHPRWGDPFVEEWQAFYRSVVENRPPKTGPADFVQDLELFAEMARLMREG